MKKKKTDKMPDKKKNRWTVWQKTANIYIRFTDVTLGYSF